MQRDERLGRLLAVLRLALPAGRPARGTLVFVWPDAAETHPVVRRLASWVERFGRDEDGSSGELAVHCRSVTIQEHPTVIKGTRLQVEFPLSAIPATMTELLWLAARLGIADEVRARLEEAGIPEADDRDLTEPPGAVPIADDATKADRITPNAVYDPLIHPRVAVNEQVTNSEGVTFRLVVKRVGKRRQRVWTKIPAERPRVTPPLHAHQRILHPGANPSSDRRHRRVAVRNRRADVPGRDEFQQADHLAGQTSDLTELAST
jgi:hypothetical protein